MNLFKKELFVILFGLSFAIGTNTNEPYYIFSKKELHIQQSIVEKNRYLIVFYTDTFNVDMHNSTFEYLL